MLGSEVVAVRRCDLTRCSFALHLLVLRIGQVWDAISGAELRSLPNLAPEGSTITSMTLDPTGGKLVVGTSEGGVVLHRCDNGAFIKTPERGHSRDVLDARYLAPGGSAGFPAKLGVRKPTDIHALPSVPRHAESPRPPREERVPASRLLASVGWDKALHVHMEVEDEVQALRSLSHVHERDVTACTLSYELSVVITASAAFDVRVWDFCSFAHLATLHHHRAELTSLALLASHSVLFSADAAGQIAMWQLCVANRGRVVRPWKLLCYWPVSARVGWSGR